MPSAFLAVFAKSPIKPIEEHILKVLAASEQLIPFFNAVYAKDWNTAAEVRKNIVALEKDADALKRDIRIHLPRGLFLPVDRTDILELVAQQDKIANKAKDITGRVLGRELEIPEPIQAEFATYLQRCVDAVSLASEAINELDELLETGFRGREVDLVIKMVEKIDAIEHDTDQMQIGLRKYVRKSEHLMNPVYVMFLYRTLEWVGDLADTALRVGSRLEIMLAR
jgi:predicted phosphate transport protein (TIGR00153 family)